MGYQKLAASMVVLALLASSFCNIQSAISSPSSARQRVEEVKARLLERKEAIKQRFGRGHHHDATIPGSSWQPLFCETSCPDKYTSPSSASVVSVNGQQQFRLELGTSANTGGCTSNRVGAQINLPQGTPAGVLKFDKFTDFQSEQDGVEIQLLVYNNDSFVAYGGIPNQVNGNTQTFDLQNLLSGPSHSAQSAPPGSTITMIRLALRLNPAIPNDGTNAGGTFRVANPSLDGLGVEDTIVQTSCQPDF